LAKIQKIIIFVKVFIKKKQKIMKYEGLTDKQRTGFDIIVKSLQKKYPFIVGWDEHNHWREYDVKLYIDLLVDVNKLSEYFDMPIFKYRTKTGIALYDPLNVKENGYDKIREVESNISDKMETMYEYLPEGYNVIYKEFSDGPYYRNLDIGRYRFIYND
jgi:hypothetical protein